MNDASKQREQRREMVSRMQKSGEKAMITGLEPSSLLSPTSPPPLRGRGPQIEFYHYWAMV